MLNKKFFSRILKNHVFKENFEKFKFLDENHVFFKEFENVCV